MPTHSFTAKKWGKDATKRGQTNAKKAKKAVPERKKALRASFQHKNKNNA